MTHEKLMNIVNSKQQSRDNTVTLGTWLVVRSSREIYPRSLDSLNDILY